MRRTNPTEMARRALRPDFPVNPPASHPILTCTEAKAWEAGLLPDEAAEWDAMQRAGQAIAEAVIEDYRELGGWPTRARLLVLAGKGHNGGDALIAAKVLLDQLPQSSVDVVFACGEERLRPLAARSWQNLYGTGLPGNVRRVPMDQAVLSTAYDVCLDGVFGMQFRPPLDETVAEVLAKANTHPRIRLRASVDLPSGLGDENAGTVFRADFTYANGIVKAPVIDASNAAFVGRLRYLDLGFFPDAGGPDGPGPRSAPPAATSRVLLASVLGPLTGPRPAQSDKRTYGHLLVVGGSLSYPGAVLLSVQAALRSGVGLLTACVPEPLVPEYAARFPEAMWVGVPVDPSGGQSPAGFDRIVARFERATALAIGPGLGAEPGTLELARRLTAASPVPLLLDADALRPDIVAAATGKSLVCTPHEGEWRRVSGAVPAGAVVVRKGPLTRVTSAGMTFVSPHGGPVLARGGSGDLLAGLIGGLLAQSPNDPLLAACRGTVWHGLAADLLARDRGQVAVQTAQLLDYLQPALELARHES